MKKPQVPAVPPEHVPSLFQVHFGEKAAERLLVWLAVPLFTVSDSQRSQALRVPGQGH